MNWGLFICADCGYVFAEPKRYMENHGEAWGAPALEEWSVCPACEEAGYRDYNGNKCDGDLDLDYLYGEGEYAEEDEENED